MDYGLEGYLDSLDPDDSDYGYSADMILAEACENPRRRAVVAETAGVADLRVMDIHEATIARGADTREITPLAPKFSAYDVWDYHTSAADEMRWNMDKRKRAFEARMKSWKRVLEMCESGELQ